MRCDTGACEGGNHKQNENENNKIVSEKSKKINFMNFVHVTHTQTVGHLCKGRMNVDIDNNNKNTWEFQSRNFVSARPAEFTVTYLCQKIYFKDK